MSDHALVPMVKLDLTNVKTLRRPVLFAVVLGIGFSLMGGLAASLPVFTVIVMVLGIQPFSRDDTYRLPLLYGALPIRRRTVMASHYLITLLGVLGSATLMLACVALAITVDKATLPNEALGGILMLEAMTMLLALILPLLVKFGARNLTLVTFTVGAAAAGIVFLVVQVIDLAAITQWLALNMPLVTGIGALGSLSALCLSYLISASIYQRKDF